MIIWNLTDTTTYNDLVITPAFLLIQPDLASNYQGGSQHWRMKNVSSEGIMAERGHSGQEWAGEKMEKEGSQIKR